MKLREDALMTLSVAISLLSIGALIGVSATDVEPGHGWLYDFQTLVAGALAIAAAGITVFEMRRNDERQQDRHQELMGLNLRMDRLRAKRAAIPYAGMIELKARYMQKKADALEGFDIEADPQTYKIMLRELRDMRDNIEKILQEESIVAAKDMFGSNMSFTYKSLLETVSASKSPANMVALYINSQLVAPNEVAKTGIETLLDYCPRISGACREFSEQLKQLSRYYHSIPSWPSHSAAS